MIVGAGQGMRRPTAEEDEYMDNLHNPCFANLIDITGTGSLINDGVDILPTGQSCKLVHVVLVDYEDAKAIDRTCKTNGKNMRRTLYRRALSAYF